jgi:hypothetical protein
LIQRRLSDLGIKSDIMPDPESANDAAVFKVRSLEIDENGFNAYQTPETPAVRVLWSDVLLLVVGRLTFKRVELKEQKGIRAENKILASSEFATDEAVVDLYAADQPIPFRIRANNFDFSCLGKNKQLVATQNMTLLLDLIRCSAPQAEYDESYNSVRKVLEVVWPMQQQNESGGWRRERPGKYSIGSAAALSNETQFLWYSRLCCRCWKENS